MRPVVKKRIKREIGLMTVEIYLDGLEGLLRDESVIPGLTKLLKWGAIVVP